MDLIYFTVFAAVTAAINFASVELKAVIDCVLDLKTIAAPQYVREKTVVDTFSQYDYHMLHQQNKLM